MLPSHRGNHISWFQPMLLTPVAPLLALDPPEVQVVAIILLYYIVKNFS